jgi:hypothetical protein
VWHPCHARHILRHVQRFDHIGTPLIDGLATLPRHKFRQSVQVAFDELSQLVDILTALDSRGASPRFERLSRRVHRAVNILGGGTGSSAHYLTGIGRIVALETVARDRLLPLTANQIHRLDRFHRFSLLPTYSVPRRACMGHRISVRA